MPTPRYLGFVALGALLLAAAPAFAAGGLPPHGSEISAAPDFHPLWAAYAPSITASHRERTRARGALTALPEDAAWEGFVAPAVARGYARSAEYHGKLVLCGDITAAGHNAAGGIVLWDGAQFEATPPVSPVLALTVWNDHIVAAVRPSNLSLTYILSLNGTYWDTLGTTNTYGAVTDMTVFENRLVAVGGFTALNGVSLLRVAAFDGVSWAGFGGGFSGSGTGLNSVVVHSGTLVVGGTIAALSNIASWNAVSGTWQSLGAGLDNFVTDMVSDGVNLFAAGHFKNSGATPMAGVARWDGVTWNSVGTPLGSEPNSITLWNGKVAFPIPNGVARLMVWDGVGITAIPGDSIGFDRGIMPSNSGSVQNVGTWGTKLVVTGNFFRNGSVPAPGILLYDGSQWSTVGEAWDATQRGPDHGDVTDMRAWGGKLVIAGQFGLVADLDHYATDPGIVAWDGTHWSALGSGIFGTQTWLGEYKGDLIAAGWLTGVRPFPSSSNRVIRWNGLSWSGFGTNAPDFATSIQQFRDDLYIGSYANLSNLSKWNGTSWSAVPGSDTGPYVYALGTTADSLVVGGIFDGTSGPPSPNVAFWDGASWRAAGAGVNDVVLAIANWNGRVVIGGEFTASGTTALPGVAVWDGASWQPLGNNVVAVDRLRVVQGELLASGDFRLPDDTVVETVARYIGPDWQLLGSGSNNYVFEGFGGDLYQAGTGIVHGHVAHSLARRALPPVLDVPRPKPGPVALSAGPNPCGPFVRLSFTLPTRGRVRLSVLDVTGRELARLADGVAEAGPHEFSWSTPSRPGVYFALLEAPGGLRQVKRVARLR